jgi:hypothetical protein
MSAPQIKERPASMLRAMFAGFGSLMSVVDKVRGKPATEAPSDAEASAPATTPAPAGAATAAPETETPETETPEAVVPEASAPAAVAESEVSTGPETVAAETVAAETVAPETVATETAAAVPGGELPLANYDELSVASLRARLRNLTNDDLGVLMTYERANQNRPEVIKMFQNRLIKMTSGLPKLVE